MAPEGLIPETPSPSFLSLNKAKRYNRSKLIAGLISSGVSFLFLTVLVVSGATRGIEEFAKTLAGNDYGALLLFGVAVASLHGLVTLPMGFFSGYVLEHRYLLSNQTLWGWARERLKGTLIAVPLMLAGLGLVYYCLHRFGSWWWVPTGVFFTVFTVIAVRLAPILLLPLFYRFVPIDSGTLFERIQQLCQREHLQCNHIYAFDLSKNSKKANAGFTGMGKTRRVILSDTLLEGFDEEEIETVFAHELGHRRYRHIAKGVGVGTVFSFCQLFVASLVYRWLAPMMGYMHDGEIASLPLLALSVGLVGLFTGFFSNTISRSHEREADAYAVQLTGNKQAFLSALRKLSAMNLADPEPHPVVEFLFYSHPSIARRLKAVEMMTI
jgi:STE24 endopeptidase